MTSEIDLEERQDQFNEQVKILLCAEAAEWILFHKFSREDAMERAVSTYRRECSPEHQQKVVPSEEDKPQLGAIFRQLMGLPMADDAVLTATAV